MDAAAGGTAAVLLDRGLFLWPPVGPRPNRRCASPPTSTNRCTPYIRLPPCTPLRFPPQAPLLLSPGPPPVPPACLPHRPPLRLQGRPQERRKEVESSSSGPGDQRPHLMAGGMLLTAPPALAASGSPYEALRVGRAGTQVEIKGAYRAMAKRLELSAGLLSTPGCRPTSGNGTTASSTTWALSVLRHACCCGRRVCRRCGRWATFLMLLPCSEVCNSMHSICLLKCLWEIESSFELGVSARILIYSDVT